MQRFCLFLLCVLALRAQAAVGLTTVPEREGVRLTIYNAVDLTLVQERRTLVLKPGMNRIQYQWHGTLIDSTSLQLRALQGAEQVEILDVVYPPGAPATLVWQVQSERGGSLPFEISYFTSGLSWQADYTLRSDVREEQASLEGHVAIVNASGEDYQRAEIRLVVGTINLVEQIRDLATGQLAERRRGLNRNQLTKARRVLAAPTLASGLADSVAAMSVEEDQAEVVSRSLADYHLFTISGRQQVLQGATTRFLAVESSATLPLEVLYRVVSGSGQAEKLYRFVNDAEHHLPNGPLPEGQWTVLRNLPGAQLAWTGQVHSAYIPPGQKVELSLGGDPALRVDERLLDVQRSDVQFDRDGRVSGSIRHQRWQLALVNTKDIPVSLEYLVRTPGGVWFIEGLQGERRDETTYRLQERLAAGQEFTKNYVISTREGTRAEEQTPPATIPSLRPLPVVVLEP